MKIKLINPEDVKWNPKLQCLTFDPTKAEVVERDQLYDDDIIDAGVKEHLDELKEILR